jgi:hypothetical protein
VAICDWIVPTSFNFIWYTFIAKGVILKSFESIWGRGDEDVLLVEHARAIKHKSLATSRPFLHHCLGA